MTDQQKLYFLGLLAQAYDAPNPRQAIARALEQIHALGKQPEYQEGYQNFKTFLHEILTDHDLAKDLADNILATIETAELEKLPDDKLNALLEIIQDETIPSPETPDSTLCELTLQTTDGQRREIQLRKGEPSDLHKITPGEYTLTLPNGREIWTGKLQPEQLIWSLAHSGEALPAAAATAPTTEKPSFSMDLLGGEITLEAFPGIENGTLRLQWKK